MWSWRSSDHEKNAVILEGCGKIWYKETLLILELTQKSGMVSGLGCAVQTIFPFFSGSSVSHRSLSGGDMVTWINEAFKFMQVFPIIFSGPARLSLFFSVIRAFLSKSTICFSAPKVTFLPIKILPGHHQAVLSLNHLAWHTGTLSLLPHLPWR